jgi:hypothetical protein
MKCTNCQIDKLSKEFPTDVIGKKCSHIPSFCLKVNFTYCFYLENSSIYSRIFFRFAKCLINYFDVQKSDQALQKCPECEVIISKQEVKDLILAWEKALFRINIKNKKIKNNVNQNGENNTAKGNIYVILLNGTKLNFKLEDLNTVADLKEAIEKQTKVRINKQKLSYKGVELQVSY